MTSNLVRLFVFAWTAMSLIAADFRIPMERYKLKNGLRVVLSRDNTTPVVAVYVIYGVGARSEERGRTGFAHLFEHMMFQGSKNAPKGTHFKMVESSGGSMNGSTHPDYTDYFEVLPSNKLAVALWLESDRMRSLAITQENLANQKEAVKQERRLGMDNRPYNTAIVDRWPEIAFRNWGNSHSLIGSFEDLNAAGVSDVARFFKTYYAPNNAALVVVGDIRPDEAKKLIEESFADIEPQPQPKGPDLTEPERKEERHDVYKDSLAQVPMVVIGYPGPARRSPDFYALGMLDLVLTGGDSSRFQQHLVKGKQSVLDYEVNLGWPFGDPSDYRDPNVYGMFLVHNPAFTGDQVVDQVAAELKDVQDNGVTQKELERARTFLRASHIRGLQTTFNRARLLGVYEMFDGDANLINSDLENYMKVTREQVRDVAQRYLQTERRAVLEIVPAPAQEEKPE